MEREERYIKNLKYADISRALSRDFLRVFCVNTETDFYVEYKPHEQDEALDILTRGTDFDEVVEDLKEKCCSEDRDTFCIAFSKSNILKVLSIDKAFTLEYRMMINEEPVYVKLKGVRINPEDPTHVLLGICNNDAHMRRMAMYENTVENALTYNNAVETLASDYFCIYCVDMQTGSYKEYRLDRDFKKQGSEVSGNDFFSMMRDEFIDAVYGEDKESFIKALQKKNLIRNLSLDHSYVLPFRVVHDGNPVYVRMNIKWLAADDDRYIVAGLSDADAHMKRIERYPQIERLAYKDSLTGVKSKHAYLETEKSLNDKLRTGMIRNLAIVVYDVNGLKQVNDTKGHQAGDEYLRHSCKMICNVFSHSPVYRIGGDEFAAFLTGRDYENRNTLIHQLHKLSSSHIGTNEAIVSGGMAEYDPDQDQCIRDIFERADAEMYKEKMLLKSLGAVIRDDESDRFGPNAVEPPVINKRKNILIADDLEVNREIMGNLLENDYDILYASDGIETMEMLQKHKDEIALLLLDLYMPNMTGREVIRKMQVDEDLMSIPVVMLTVDHEAELDSLRIGAMDFISKPYPDIDIVKARIAKCIELSEDRNLIRHTQRDKLTGLYNIDYFMHYVNRFDHQYRDVSFDAFVCDIHQFRFVNEAYGRQFGDLVLRSIGKNVRRLARKTGGIGARQGADTFLLYCPHQNNYEQLIEKFKADLLVEEELADKINLKFGVFINANQEPDVEERFICAKIAADGAADDPAKIIMFYNDEQM